MPGFRDKTGKAVLSQIEILAGTIVPFCTLLIYN